MVRRSLLVAALALLLAGCSGLVERLPIGERSTAEPVVPFSQQATAVAQPATPTPSGPRPTSPPLPDVPPQPTIAAELSAPVSAQEALLVELYRRASPAVVSIDVIGDSRLPEDHPMLPGFSDVPFSQGSGFLFDSQGYIVTNNHVIEGANSLLVTFHDGSSIEAQVVGRDPYSDLAVIKVDGLPGDAAPLPLGNSREVAVGQTAIAIGNPFGEQNTLTVGVISGLGRSLRGPASEQGIFSIPNVIQTDAAINPGNSGGPLLNVRREVIGVNTAIRSANGFFEGVGYAVPASAVERIVPVLIADGQYEHPWIGIRMFAVDPFVARRFELDTNQGVLIQEVVPGSPAAAARLQAGLEQVEYAGGDLLLGGDIIVAIENQVVRDSDDLIGYLALETSVGDTVTLTVMRDGSEQQVPVTLEARPAQ